MSLSCPKCRKCLVDLEIEGIQLDFCERCKGIWFDNDDLLYFLKAHAGIPDLKILAQEAVQSGNSCPHCNISLHELGFAVESNSTSMADNNLLIDRCSKCGGIWLDEGEFEKVKIISSKVPENQSKLSNALNRFAYQKAVICEHVYYSAFDKKYVIPFLIAALIIGMMIGHSCRDAKNTAPSLSVPAASEIVCPDCKGRGEIFLPCTICNGKGTVSQSAVSGNKIVCPKCSGSRKIETEKEMICGKCAGTGQIGGGIENCRRCNGMGSISNIDRRICPVCRGSGQMAVKKICSACGGSGKSSINPQWGCPGCSGTGRETVKQTCPHCSGGTMDIKSSKICPSCHGSGRTAVEKKVCDGCLGEGKIVSKNLGVCDQCHGTGSIMLDSPAGPCPNCNGTGFSRTTTQCERCKGKGKIIS